MLTLHSEGALNPLTFQGVRDRYSALSPNPVFFGRVSVFFAVKAHASDDELLLKHFHTLTEDGSALSSFQREMNLLVRLKHPNVLEIRDHSPFTRSTEAPFIVVAWCKGGNLRDLIRGRDFVPLSSALPILRQVASAIDFAHEQGVIHGDIKPENVLLSSDLSQVFLCDFGMSKNFEVTDRVISQQLTVGGSSAYLSPEQLNGERHTPSSDLYSFGLLAFEMLTGRLPFNVGGPLFHQLNARVLGNLLEARKVNPALSETVEDMLKRVLALTPSARPASATEFCDGLSGRSIPVRVVTEQLPPKPTKTTWWGSLEPAGKAGVIAAGLAAATGVITAIVNILPKLLGRTP